MTFTATPGAMLVSMPPLRQGDARHPRHDRRAVNGRWLLATTVLALAAAALLGGVLQAGLHRALKVRAAELALAPGLGRAGSSDGRGDKLASRGAPPPSEPSPIVTQTLQSTGLGDRPLTVLVADLAHMGVLARVPDDPPPLLQAGAEAGMVHDRAAPRSALPPLVLFGTANPAGAPHPASYAPASIPGWAEPGPLGTAVNVTEQAQDPPEAPDRDSVVIAQRGDPLDRLLPGFGLTPANLAELAAALHIGRLAGGERFVLRLPAVQLDPAGRPVAVRLERPDGTTLAAALSDDGRYLAVARPAERPAAATDTAAPDAAGEIDDASLQDGLDALAGHAGVGRALAAAITRVLGTDLDLGKAVAAGDRIEVLFGTDPAEGGEDQDLDYAALTVAGKTTRLYRFASADDNSVDYYDEAGHSLTKFLLRKPVANGRLGDGFGWRTHPILGDRRFHEGVDYAAPYGSPIVAAGAGTVEKIDVESGYGKYIRIRHDLGYETTYAHVAGFPRGMTVGRRVQQGETIALVGSTGLSTGPHLYYEVRVNDRNVDPTRIRIAAGRILEGQALATFARRRDRIDTLLKATRQSNS